MIIHFKFEGVLEHVVLLLAAMIEDLKSTTYLQSPIYINCRLPGTVTGASCRPGRDAHKFLQHGPKLRMFVSRNVVSLDTADSQSIAKFFTWVSASIGVTSTKV